MTDDAAVSDFLWLVTKTHTTHAHCGICETMEVFVLNVWLVVFVVTSFRYFLQEETSTALWSVFQTSRPAEKLKKIKKSFILFRPSVNKL